MFKLIDKKIIAILHKLFFLNWPYEYIWETPPEYKGLTLLFIFQTARAKAEARIEALREGGGGFYLYLYLVNSLYASVVC